MMNINQNRYELRETLKIEEIYSVLIFLDACNKLLYIIVYPGSASSMCLE